LPGGFSIYPKEQSYRVLTMTCGGCCGRATHRKLTNLLRTMQKKEGIAKDRVVVQLSSCIAKSNYHGPPCAHLGYIKTLIERVGLEIREGTVISEKSERCRRSAHRRRVVDLHTPFASTTRSDSTESHPSVGCQRCDFRPSLFSSWWKGKPLSRRAPQ
jgi:predicted metal-binding protein